MAQGQDLEPELLNNIQGTDGGNHVLNVGRVLIFQNGPDPVFATREERLKNDEATRLRARFFSLGRPGSFSVSVPSAWAAFFTHILLSLGEFDWAKGFMQSKASSCLRGNHGVIEFSLPKVYPVNSEPSCSLISHPSTVSDNYIDKGGQSPSSLKKGKGKRAPVL
jgi:hypothetical protein